MKKFLFSVVVLAGGLAAASASFAASATVNLTVTVTSGSVTISNSGAATLNFGTMVVGASALSEQGTFSNTGDTLADWSIEATNFTNGTNTWTLLSDLTPVSVNTCRLFAVFKFWSTPNAGSNYGPEDIVTASAQPCDTNRFAITSDLDQYKGFNVPAGQPRDIVFRFDAPAAGSAGLTTEMTSVVTVTSVIGL